MNSVDCQDFFQGLIESRQRGSPAGTCSVCSADPRVIGAAMVRARDGEPPLLIESTAHQVNQFGGSQRRSGSGGDRPSHYPNGGGGRRGLSVYDLGLQTALEGTGGRGVTRNGVCEVDDLTGKGVPEADDMSGRPAVGNVGMVRFSNLDRPLSLRSCRVLAAVALQLVHLLEPPPDHPSCAAADLDLVLVAVSRAVAGDFELPHRTVPESGRKRGGIIPVHLSLLFPGAAVQAVLIPGTDHLYLTKKGKGNPRCRAGISSSTAASCS